MAIFWLGQAGFAFKTAAGKVIYIDPYLSDVVEKDFGFKRMMPAPISAEDVRADVVLCTHEHLDHMDTDALPIIARNTQALFAGPIECLKGFARVGIPEDRCVLLELDKTVLFDEVSVTGVYADHGESAPDALGLVVEIDGMKIYHSGDTAYRQGEMGKAATMKPDVLIPCINGAFGNMNSRDAAQLTRDVSPTLAIASHFWMFVIHGGDPASYLEFCKEFAPQTEAIVMQPGEMRVFGLAREQRPTGS
ncbi:MAG: MBL fold metallo-hydrolase [Bryobacteraceae bacterium]